MASYMKANEKWLEGRRDYPHSTYVSRGELFNEKHVFACKGSRNFCQYICTQYDCTNQWYAEGLDIARQGFIDKL